MNAPIRVLLADDQPAIRAGMTVLLELESGVTVVAQAASGHEVCAYLQANPGAADAVLMDIKMPQMSGVQAARAIREMGGPPVVLFTTFEDVDDMLSALDAGVSGYLFKDLDGEEMAWALRRAVAGERVIDPRVHRAVAQARALQTDRDRSLEGLQLTPREVEVLSLLTAGGSNKQIGNLLGMTEGTVKVHMNRILSKLGVKTRTEAALRAVQLGLDGE